MRMSFPISTLGNYFLLFFFQSLVKKMKHPLFHFCKWLEDKLWLWVGLGRCDG